MRNNRSNLVLVLLLIAIFSIQTFSTSELTPTTHSDKSSNQTISTNSQKIVSHNQVTTTNSTNTTNIAPSLRNLSVSDLFNFLKYTYSKVPNSFIDSSSDFFDTSITVAQALAVLKIMGFTNYIITSDKNKTLIFNNFKQVNGGFLLGADSIHPSIAGTYGAVETAELLNLILQIGLFKDQAITFLNSKYHNTTTIGGFRETFQANVIASIQSTYFAVQTLKTLGINVNKTQKIQIYEFLNSLWNSNGKYFSNKNDPDQSTILTTFEAITILKDLGDMNTALWSNVTAGFPSFVNSIQETSGIYKGAIHLPNTVANVDDTGIALTSLYMLNKMNDVNVSLAVQFIIRSQYNSSSFANDIGGFSYNNSTQSSLSQFSGVTLTHTYYAILGLYATGYISNNTNLNFQTDYSVNNHLNNLKNEILVGQNATITAQLNYFNYKNYFDSQNISLHADGLNIRYNSSTSTSTGFEYTFLLVNKSSNYYLGAHNLTFYYSLSNFFIIPTIQNEFHSQITVRFPISNLINGLNTTQVFSPGNLLKGQVKFDNLTVNKTNIDYSVLGNVSVSLVYPNGTSQQLNSSYTFALNMSEEFYSYNISIPNNAVLGDYMINVTYINGTVQFFSEQTFNIRTTVYLMGITSSKNRNLYPQSDYGLTFDIAYKNGYINPDISNITAQFSSSTNDKNLFSANLVSIGGNNFAVNSTEKVPAGLFMGSYNVTIALLWNSTTTNSSLPMSLQNKSLAQLDYQGFPIITNYQISPLDSRSSNTTIYSGDEFNLTASIGVKYAGSQVFLLHNTSFDITAVMYNSSNSKDIFQSLSFVNLNNSKISVYGQIDPNLNLQSNVGLTLLIKIKYQSTDKYNPLSYIDSTNKTVEYLPSFTLKKANLELDQKSIDFVIGSSTVSLNEYTTLLVSFKVLSLDNSAYVTGLKLNATLALSGNGNNNQYLLPAVTSLEANSSYQLQIPVNNLNVGKYVINVNTLIANQSLGSFNLNITPVKNNTSIPIENFIALGTVSLAVILTIVAYNTRKKN